MSRFEMPLKHEDIAKILPHRYPFLLVDRVTGFEDHKWIEGYKNVSANEEFFLGHFPGKPIMPGVLMLEALAQLGSIFWKLCSGDSSDGALLVFSGCEDVKFRRQVVPGDVITMKMTLIKSKFGHWKMNGITKVGDELAVDGVLMATEVR
jgi:3-hydroxyacyl-[acyl-carrier-protein] dehydratase